MRTVISFSEGCSGNFLASFITTTNVVNTYRIDSPENGGLNYSILPFLDNFTKDNYKSVIVTHEHDSQTIRSLLNPDQLIRIEPVTGLFTALYNVFTKKLVGEGADILTRWPAEPSYCYDRSFEHLKDYYLKFSTSHLTSDEIFFDFGWIYDTPKMINFLKKINMSGNFDLLERYKKSQLPLLLNLPHTNKMSNIVSLIPEDYFIQSPWFACYCIFCFELNNNLLEDQRLWSINDLSVLGSRDLIKLSFKYRL